ncbi:MAG: hypothetical protein WCD21_39080, partial [Streptomyces sp.]
MSGGVPDSEGSRPEGRRRTGLRDGRLGRLLQGPSPEGVPTLVARACTLVGLLNVAAGVFPRFRNSRMHAIAEVLPGALGPFAAALALS